MGETIIKSLVIYIHGKGGNAAEAELYRSLFTDADVVGFAYQSETPWEARTEFPAYFDEISKGYDRVYLIANSIGAYFSLHSLSKKNIKKAFLISPIADMEGLIENMMLWANITEPELREKRQIETAFGEILSIEYLDWVRENPISWSTETEIAYGEKDHLQSIEMIGDFAEGINAKLHIMENGEHWFHTDEQMSFLYSLISNGLNNRETT